MDCHEFEECLEALLDGSATAEHRQDARDHTAACARCRELDALIGADIPAAVDVPAGLAGAVLERTSGSPCGRARGMLCDLVDGGLEGADAELLSLHRAHCRDCDSLGFALRRMSRDLPALALADPGPRFVDEVLAATLPLDRRLVRLGRRLRGVWERLTQRPRFVWEASYVGALLLFFVFGTPASPLSAVPGQALALAQVNPLHALRDSPLGQVPGNVSSWSKQAWNATGGQMLSSGEGFGKELGVRLQRAGKASKGLFQHGMELGEALFQGNLDESFSVLKNMGGDLVSIWNRLVAAEEEEPTDDPSSDSSEGD